jgi:hypothetical protein
MTRFAAVLAMGIAGASLFASTAHAETGFSLDAFFNGYGPPPQDDYFFDDGYRHDVAVSDPADDFYVREPSLYDYDDGFYEPRYVPSKKRIDRLRDGLRAQAVPRKRNAASLKVASASPKLPLETVKPKPPAVAKLVLPKETPGGVSCDKAIKIVGGYGFSEVKPTTCTGDIFAFAAMRGGKAYDILLSAKNGALTEVKRR